MPITTRLQLKIQNTMSHCFGIVISYRFMSTLLCCRDLKPLPAFHTVGNYQGFVEYVYQKTTKKTMAA